MSLSEILKKIRTEGKLSVRQLANKIGLDHAYLSRVENGTVPPSDRLLKKVSKVFKIDFNRLRISSGKLPNDIYEIFTEHPEAVNVLREKFSIYNYEEVKRDLETEDKISGTPIRNTHGTLAMKCVGGQIFKGDCLEIMKGFDDASVDMILCDLPYGTTQNKWDSVIPLNELWKAYRRIIKPKGVIALTSQGVFTARLILSNEEWFRYKFVWVKSKPTNFLNARKQPLRQHEDICIFYGSQPNYRPVMSKGEPYNKGTRKNQYTGSYGDFRPVLVRSDGERYPTDTVYCKTAESEAGGRVWHPTQKPVALGRYLIRMFTGEGDVVLDNAFGSGSFLVAAALEGRKYIGIEKNEEVHLFKEKRIDYIKVAKQRLAEVDTAIKSKQPSPPLFSALQPAARAGQPNRKGMVDVDTVIHELVGQTL